MKIGINARGQIIQSGGAKEFTKKSIEGILEFSKYPVYVYYSSAKLLGTFKHKNCIERVPLKNFQFLFNNSLGALFWENVILPLAMKKDKIDVAFHTKSTIPFLNTTPSVVAILDLAYLYPGLNAYKLLDTLHKKLLLPRSVRKSKKIIAISQNTRQDVFRFYKNIEKDKVEVVYLDAVYKQDVSEKSKIELYKKYGLPKEPFIFMATSLSPRKNIVRAVEAVGKISKKIPHHFVFTGGKSWNSPDLDSILDKYDLESKIHKIGFVDDEDMFSVYKHSDVYFNPSLYEGFGITLLEAMNAGKIVVASDVSSHPEVAGDAAILCDPYNIDDMAAKLLTACTNEEKRKELLKNTKKQIKKFSWENTSKQIINILEEVHESNS